MVGLLSTRCREAEFLAWGWRVGFCCQRRPGGRRPLHPPEHHGNAGVRQGQGAPSGGQHSVHRHDAGSYRSNVLLGMGARYIDGVFFNIFAVFSIGYLVNTVKIPRTKALLGVSIAALVMIFTIPVFGALSDKRRPAQGLCDRLDLAGAVRLSGLLAFNTRRQYVHHLTRRSSCRSASSMRCATGRKRRCSADLFDPRVRYTGISFVYQFSGIFASGITPIIATYLFREWRQAMVHLRLCRVRGAGQHVLGDRDRKDPRADIGPLCAQRRRTEKEARPMRMTTEEAFVKVLQRHGIEHAFGIIGSAFMPISDLFPKAGITFWDCAHEGNGGMMADGFTRATGKMAMMRSPRTGPGITNFVTADQDRLLEPHAAAAGHAAGGQPHHRPGRLPGSRADGAVQGHGRLPGGGARPGPHRRGAEPRHLQGAAPARRRRRSTCRAISGRRSIDIELPQVVEFERPAGGAGGDRAGGAAAVGGADSRSSSTAPAWCSPAPSGLRRAGREARCAGRAATTSTTTPSRARTRSPWAARLQRLEGGHGADRQGRRGAGARHAAQSVLDAARLRHRLLAEGGARSSRSTSTPTASASPSRSRSAIGGDARQVAGAAPRAARAAAPATRAARSARR